MITNCALPYPRTFVTTHHYFAGDGASCYRGFHGVNIDRFNAFDFAYDGFDLRGVHFLSTHVDDCAGAADNSEIVVIVCFDKVARAIPAIRLKVFVGSI